MCFTIGITVVYILSIYIFLLATLSRRLFHSGFNPHTDTPVHRFAMRMENVKIFQMALLQRKRKMFFIMFFFCKRKTSLFYLEDVKRSALNDDLLVHLNATKRI